MPDTLTHALFLPLLNQSFEVQVEEDILPCELIKADVYPVREKVDPATAGGRAPFSLVFRGPQDSPFPQNTYLVKHKAFTQPLSIFLVPIGPDDQGPCYEAVFF